MTAEAFDRLLYTDCRAGTGRGAGGGFQIQAQSSGVDAAQARMALGWLLYEAQNAWIVQHRAVSEFPPGFAHTSAAGYGTSQSRYLGQEATGGRQGNHLADCILTRNPDLYGPTRPAQLWRSDLWRAEPWDSIDCPPLDGDPPPGPLTVGVIASWLQERLARREVLGRLVSVLEDPAGRRVIISATSPDDAVAWIAAATLLLPMRLALDISFKVFCANPLRTEHRIVAVPQELHPQIAPGQADSPFILDAEKCTSDDVVVSERAKFLVAQLTGADDPYDVVDAVELAESLTPGGGPGNADSIIAAWALTLPASPLTEPGALQRWLLNADHQVLQEHGTAVANRILDSKPSADALRLIDAAADRGPISIDHASLRGKLLSAELAEARDGIAPPLQQLPSVGLDFEAHRDADSELTSAILLGSDNQIDLLLRLARRHAITLEPAPLAERLQKFAEHWVAGQFSVTDPAGWALHEEILDFANDELRARLAVYGAADLLAALRRLHPHLTSRAADPTDPLDAYRRVAVVAMLPTGQRAPALRALLQRVTRLPVPASEIAGMQRVLVEWGAIRPAEAFEVLTCLPESVELDPDIVRIASEELLRRAGKPDRQMLDLLAILDRRGLAPKAGPLAALRAADRNVQVFIEAARNHRILSDREYAQDGVAHLSRVDPAVFRARLKSIVAACLESPRQDLGAAVLRGVPSQRKAVLLLWVADLGGPNWISAAVWGFNCIRDPDLPSRVRTQMVDAIQEFAARLRSTERERWFLEVSRHLPAEEAQAWHVVSGHERQKSRRGRSFRDKEGG